jgi:hypothetical protein
MSHRYWTVSLRDDLRHRHVQDLPVPRLRVGGWVVGWTSDSRARNNFYWNSDVCVQSAPSSDYDASFNDLAASNQSRLGISQTTTVDQAEAHATRAPAMPFVNASTGDFHLKANTPSGETLASPSDVDGDGNKRTTRTRGAYEYHP